MLYPSAKVLIKHPSDATKILMVKRFVNGNISYEPAGGKIEVNFKEKKAETLEECAIREAREELGLLISIENYIGSYYFFWSIDPKKFSSCALFTGTIIAHDKDFKRNADTCELPIEPAWVSLDEFVNKKAPIDSLHVGLEDLIMNHFKLTLKNNSLCFGCLFCFIFMVKLSYLT